MNAETIESACLSLNPDGVPVSDRYGDVYHSAAGGHAQARHVFLAGNGLPGRWQDRERFTILETGFGLGVNFLATWMAWRNDPRGCRELHFVSVEKHPFSAADLATARAMWPEFSAQSELLCAQWPSLTAGEHRIVLEGGRLLLRLVFGDATTVFPDLAVGADAFYLDGFSPATNPELWSPALCLSLARMANPAATLATWSVAGHVRQALAGAGFHVEKAAGFAGKRHMLVGCYSGSGRPAEL